MEIAKREIISGGELTDAPGHYKITVTLEGDHEREWSVVRKPDGTYWEVVGTDVFPRTGGMLRIDLGNQIVDAKALRLCEKNYRQIRDAEAARVKHSSVIKEPPARKGFLELAKFEELSRLLPGHLRPLILFLYWCGVRLGEALSIQWEQVDLENRLIRLEEDQTKNSEPRVVPLPSVLVAKLQEMAAKTGPVFDGTNLRPEWEKACAACGLGKRELVEGSKFVRNDRVHPRHVRNRYHRYNGIIVHDLRRSAIRNLIRAGVSEQVAMRISGHKTVSVFRRYNIVATDDVTSAMRRLESVANRPALTGKKVSAKLVQIRGRHSAKPTKTR